MAIEEEADSNARESRAAEKDAIVSGGEQAVDEATRRKRRKGGLKRERERERTSTWVDRGEN